MQASASDGPVVLDFGMHEGEDTEFYLACGAKVVAFEANDTLVERNSRRFAQEIAAGRLDIEAGAIVPPDFEGSTQTFYRDNNKSVWGTTSAQWIERNTALGSDVTALTVPAIDLKAVLAERPHILYAKIDIEGADRFVLDTFKAAGRPPEFISIESDKLDLQSIIDEIETLQGLGYKRFAAVQQATIPGSSIRGLRFDGTPFSYCFKRHASGPFGPYLRQDYKSAGQVIDEYRSIFRAYARYGDQSWLMQKRWARLATRTVNLMSLKLLRRPLCGWYDTHATE